MKQTNYDARDRGVEDLFAHHNLTEEKTEKCSMLRSKATELAKIIDSDVPCGKQKAIAFEKLEEAIMWACKGISMS